MIGASATYTGIAVRTENAVRTVFINEIIISII